MLELLYQVCKKMDPVREMWHVCVHLHREASEPRASRRSGLRLSGVWKMRRLRCRVCESSMSHLIPNTAEMPKCLSRDVHTWSRDSRGRTLCSRCNSSSLRLKESGSNTPKLLRTRFSLRFVFYITRVSRFVNEKFHMQLPAVIEYLCIKHF